MPNIKKHLNWRVWLRGLIGSAINSAASGFLAAQIDPTGFNFQGGFDNLVKLVVGSALVGAFLFLKQAPLPDEEPDDAPPTQPPV